MITRRGFLAGLVALGGQRSHPDPHAPALVGVLRPLQGDGRLFAIGAHWSLLADPQAPDYTVAAVRELANTAVALDRWKNRSEA